jgi:tetratricopeptide (TPR) repeat protein
MSALPRPDLPPGPHRELVAALHELHHRAGWPSLRTLAREAGVSHTTVSKVFSSAALPPWGTVELLVEAMDADPATLHGLWLAATGPTGDPDPTGPKIAGRRDELAVVCRHLETGTGLLLVTGEAGIGKTKLVSTAAATTPAFVATGHCLPLSTEVPLLPIADALREIHQADRGAWLEEALGQCPPYVASSLSRLLPEIVPTRGPDPEDDWSRQRLFTAVATLLPVLGARSHVALLIEDLHWADTSTLDLLAHLLSRDPGVPLVGTWRLDDPDTPATHREWRERIERAGNARVLDLAALSWEETAELLRHFTGRDVDTSYVDRIHGRSVGQPLFTEQLASQGPEEPLPRQLSDLLDHRIDPLEPEARAIVGALGVADRGLPDAVLAGVTGLGTADLATGLRELAARRLLAESPDPRQVKLRHPLLAEAVRRRLVEVEVRETHRHLARVLGSEEGVSPGEVAAHWEAAGDAEQELTWRIRAARAADARFAGPQAALHWSRVLELFPEDTNAAGSPPVSRPQVYFAAMDAWDLAGESSDGLELAERARMEFATWDTADRADLLRKLAAYRSPGGEVEGDDLTAEAIALFRQCPQTPELADRLAVALIHQSFTLSFRGRWTESAQALDEARSLLASQHPTSGRMREVRSLIAWQHGVAGRLDLALQEMAELAADVPDGREPVRDVMVALNHTDVLLMAGRAAEEVEAAAEHGLAAVREFGLDTYESSTLLANVVIAWIRAGRIERAAASLDAITESTPVLDRWILHMKRMVLDLARGRMDAARERADRLRELDRVTVDFMIGDLALLHVWEGEPARALELIESAMLTADHVEVNGERGQVLVLAARAAADLAADGSGSRSSVLAARVSAVRMAAHDDPFGPGAVPADRYEAPQWTAEMARLDGTESVDVWVRAADTWDRLTRPHDAAYCRWRAAQCAVRDGQGTVAARLLKRAAADAHEHVPLSRAIAATMATAS